MTQEEFNSIVRLHAMWLCGDVEGRRAYLFEADLRKLNLRFVNLSRANLSAANLQGIDLMYTNLESATLNAAQGIQFFQMNQNLAIAFKDRIKIGCECYSVKYWLQNFRKIGRGNHYSPIEIEAYGAFIRIVAKSLSKGDS